MYLGCTTDNEFLNQLIQLIITLDFGTQNQKNNYNLINTEEDEAIGIVYVYLSW